MKKYSKCLLCAHVFGRSCKKLGKVIPDEIYNNGRHYSDDSTPISFYVFLVVVLSIVTFIVNIF